jgi:sulfate adenylyltransferase
MSHSRLLFAFPQFRTMLRAGEDIPEWFAFKSVVKVLRENA